MNICMVLTPSIGSIGSRGIAGTEKMFLKDISVLSKKFNIKAYARFNHKHPSVKKLSYFVFLIKMSYKIESFKRLFFRANELANFFADLLFVLNLKKTDTRSDIFIGYSFPLIAILKNPKTIIFLHSYERFYFPQLLHKYYVNCTFIFVSNYLMNYYCNKYSFVNKNNSFVLQNSVDTKVFRPNKNPRSKKKIKILYPGAWEKVKGLHLLLQANSELEENLRTKLQITIASKPNLWYHEKFDSNKKYTELIYSLASRVKNISFLNGVEPNKMPQIYQSHDFLFFPSTWGEPASLTLIEALACGLPVIAFDVGGNTEILDTSNSKVLKNFSVDSIKQTLEQLAERKLKIKRQNMSLFSKRNIYMTDEMRERKLKKFLNSMVTS